jgi:addiction module RelB/DinJ family antitoxin
MKTVLNVKTDKDVKEKAQALAKHLGIPLSTVVNAQLKSFIESGEFKLTREPELRPEVIKEINAAIKEVEAGIGLSPVFDNVSDMMKWLDTETS